MKSIASAALFGCLLVPHIASSSSEAILHDELLIETFRSCNQAIKNPEERSVYESRDITMRHGHRIKLLGAKFSPPPTRTGTITRIVVWIENTASSGPEFPEIVAVCIRTNQDPWVLEPQIPGKKYGDIDFHSHTGDDIQIRVHLEGLQ